MSKNWVQALKARGIRHLAEGLCRHCTRPLVPGKKSCDYHLEYYRRRRREEYRRVRKSKLCLSCGSRPPVTGGATCDVCRKAMRAYQRRLIEDGKCRCGGPSRPGRTLCQECADRRSESEILLRLRRWERGLCTLCGEKLVNPALALCGECRRKSRDYQREWAKRRKKQ